MHNPQSLKNFNQLQTAIHLSQKKLPKNILTLVLHYLLTPSRIETTIDSIAFLLSLGFYIPEEASLRSIRIKLQDINRNPKPNSRAVNSFIRDAKKSMINAIKSNEDKILFYAFEQKKEHVILMLLKLPVVFNLNATDRDELTPLMLAAKYGYTKTLALLLEKGVDVNAKNKYEWSALRHAAASERKETVELLLEKGANIDDKDHGNNTVLMDAIYYGHKEIHKNTVALLLEKGANIHAVNNVGWTALTLAASIGEKKTVELLLENGADIYDEDNFGCNALILAIDNGREEIAALLKKAHQEQFYTQAMTEPPEELQDLLDEELPETDITRDTMCAYLFELVEKEPLVNNKIALLEGALGNHAFGALMKQSDPNSSSSVSSAVTKIEQAKESYKPSAYVEITSTFTMQYTQSSTLQRKRRLSDSSPSL